MKNLFHGSKNHIDGHIEPRPSRVINNEFAVFATDDKALSAVFIPKWSDCDLSLGYSDGILYCMEMYPDAFNLLKGVSGYIYTLSMDGFVTDERLGMKNHEFINVDKVPIIDTEQINDVYEYLLESHICLIKFNEMLDALHKTNLIYRK